MRITYISASVLFAALVASFATCGARAIRMTRAKSEQLVSRVLTEAGVPESHARLVARSLVAAQADGEVGHGLLRVPIYVQQIKANKINPKAEPEVVFKAPGIIHVDAKTGFAFPAIKLGLDTAVKAIKKQGVVVVTVANSHHAGLLGHSIESLASKGLVSLAMSNTPKAMPPSGGSKALFGTNPIAFGYPRAHGSPFVVDLSLSKVARSQVLLAQKKSEKVPPDWGLDANGNPTQDPQAILDGALLPMGNHKGGLLALMVELLSGGLIGSNYSFQASSVLNVQGTAPRLGQFFWILDPMRFGPNAIAVADEVARQMLEQPGVRLPNAQRLRVRKDSDENGILIENKLYQELVSLKYPTEQRLNVGTR